MITVQRVAKLLNCHTNFVYEMIRDGHLKAYRIGKRALRIPVNSYEEFMEKRAVDPNEFFA